MLPQFVRPCFLGHFRLSSCTVTPFWSGPFCRVLILFWLVTFSFTAVAKPIRLRTGTIEPHDQQGLAQAQALEAQRPPITGLYLVQLRDNPPQDWRAHLRAVGAQLLRYVPEDTFVARIPGEAVGQVRALPFVEWVGEYL